MPFKFVQVPWLMGKVHIESTCSPELAGWTTNVLFASGLETKGVLYIDQSKKTQMLANTK
jgi:hypothetical protein